MVYISRLECFRHGVMVMPHWNIIEKLNEFLVEYELLRPIIFNIPFVTRWIISNFVRLWSHNLLKSDKGIDLA